MERDELFRMATQAYRLYQRLAVLAEGRVRANGSLMAGFWEYTRAKEQAWARYTRRMAKAGYPIE